jgi:RNA polymerase sigma-70 factor (ECF subfamily)
MDFSAEQIDVLVKKAQNGNKEAFGKIYDIFLDGIYKYIFFRVSNQEVAEDITSDVFFKALRNLKKYKKKGDMPFAAWLFRIAKNNVIDFYRKNNETVEINEEVIDESVRAETERETERHIDKKRILRAMKELPEMQSHAIALKYFAERSNTEIAAILEKSETAVRILLSRGLKKMGDILQE